jgi:uncharacterized membrane protein YeiH
VLQKEIYATASILGAILYVVCHYLGLEAMIAMAIAMSGTLLLRLSAIYWHLSLPIFSDKR